MADFVRQMCDFAYDPGTGLNQARIDDDAILRLAQEFAPKEPKAQDWREPGDIFPKDDRVYACQEFYRSAINACFADPAEPDKKFGFSSPKYSGAMALGHCFYRYPKFGENPIKPADIFELTDTSGALEEFFRAEVPIPLLEERRAHLREAAEVVEQYFDGDPLNILKQACYRVADSETGDPGIVGYLQEYFPTAFGEDKVGCGNYLLTFAKRAQLWACLYHGRAVSEGSTLRPLADPENIGPILDYHVVNVMRYHGCLVYSDELAAKVDSRTPILRHSPEEIEMRAKAGAAVAKLLEVINALRPTGAKPYTMVELDAALWFFGREAAKKHPYHLCLTMDY